MHPFSPLLRGGLAVLVIAGIIIANFRDRFIEIFFGDRFWAEYGNDEVSGAQDPIGYLIEQGFIFIALGALLGIIALIVLFSWIGWRFATYRVTDDAVEERKGVLFRSHRRAPLERIQSVNLQRPLLARALGLTKIEVVTAGQGGKVELAYLSFQDAKNVRAEILGRAATKNARNDPDQGGLAPDSNVAAAGAAAIGVAPMQPAGHAVDDFTPARIGSAKFDAALTARANEFVDVDVDPMAITDNTLVRVPVPRLIASLVIGWEMVILVIVGVGVTVGAAVLDPAFVFGLLPLIIIMASLIISQFNRGFNFTLSRGSDTIRTGAGLTSTITETIPFGRIHAVQASQPLLWRGLGWWRVRVTTAGHSVAQGGQNSSQNVVLPVGTVDDVLRVFETLLPGIGDDPRETDELRDALVGPGTGYLGAGPRAGWVLWFGRRRSGVTIADASEPHATLRIRRGVLTRTLGVMPVLRAQSVLLHRPLVHRMLGLALLHAHTVLGPVNMYVRGVELEAARRFFDDFAACVLRVQGAEAREIADARALPAAPITTSGSPDVISE
ncbi:PH domain-containing protein [Leucobacter salsicius]|uniref:PH domain-containing protein n=1 Tax=Leucobacter salsicius TaxID=664638 RepID=UPI000349064C|nr:PH domain-containing protein [Leucobacter salsicius]